MSDHPSFDLLREPWIPCLEPGGAFAGDFSIREVLARAHTLQEIATSSPLATISLYRLLIAVLHAALDGPAKPAAWGAIWRNKRFQLDQIDPYLDEWRHRFDLFDPVHPFYQRADLEEEYAKSIVQIIHELPNDGGVLFFDHLTNESSTALTPAEAARALVAAQTFATGGLISLRKGEDTKTFKSADASPVFKCAITLVRGANLFETLLLNLHRYHHADGMPMQVANGDKPAWERSAPTEAADRIPDGYRDLLTWQSRRARLIPRRRPDGTIEVTHVVFMKGYQFPEGVELVNGETMVPFRKDNRKSATMKGWTSLTIRGERALWRDSAAIFHHAGQRGDSAEIEFQRPRMFTWLGNFDVQRELGRTIDTLDVEVFGIESDRANLKSWRQESLPLPMEYLTTPEFALALQPALELAQAVSSVLNAAVSRFAELALAPESDLGGRQADRAKGVTPLRDAIDVGAAYWPFLEAPFLRLLRELPKDRALDDGGEPVYGQAALKRWGADVERIADDAIRRALLSGGTSGRMLKASAQAEGLYRAYMRRPIEAFAVQTERGIEVDEFD